MKLQKLVGFTNLGNTSSPDILRIPQLWQFCRYENYHHLNTINSPECEVCFLTVSLINSAFFSVFSSSRHSVKYSTPSAMPIVTADIMRTVSTDISEEPMAFAKSGAIAEHNNAKINEKIMAFFIMLNLLFDIFKIGYKYEIH
jgi:hypothetical protein